MIGIKRSEPYLLILPSTLFLGAFFLWPTLEAFALALIGDKGITLRFFAEMLKDVHFPRALYTTLLLTVALIPVQFFLALAMALLLRRAPCGILLYLYSLPLAISDLAAGIIWFSIFTERGYLNTLLVGLGLLDRPYVFLDYRTAWPLLAVLVAETWRATSLIFVILVAGLQAIPREYEEAAEIFGANWFRKLTRVVIPLLLPSIRTALILRTILAFQAFAVVLAVAGQAVTVLAAEAYRWYSLWRNPHVAACYAVVILLLSFTTTILYLRGMRPKGAIAQ